MVTPSHGGLDLPPRQLFDCARDGGGDPVLIVAVKQPGEEQEIVDHVFVEIEHEASTASAVARALVSLPLSGA